ncbi:uncharacterized protein LOC129582684 [Paramacrobiotus metropolitanus]|uniref:uncharacterized protein LOC129582684 n=1 Tax=Paramacrobiotus metropolitanus TaxID=2943436 RepID=UPI0024463975|nr:uncharacterized protein LOC129582684 [Paramacrobiotus metropolitanus]
MAQVNGNQQNLAILQRVEELFSSKLELCMQLQSLVDTSAQSLHAFRTHCSTSRELIKDEIRMLEGKLIQRIGRQLAVRRLLSQHFTHISQELNLSQYLETDLDVFVAQRDASISGDSQVSSRESLATETGDSAVTCVLDKIRLILDEELVQLPSLKQWLEIVGLQPACVKAIMELVGSVEELLQTSESKLKAVIVSSSGVCTCRPADVSDDSQTVPDSASEDTTSRKDSTLRVENGNTKEKGKLPFHIREDVRRLITACRLLRIYTDRLLADDSDLRELANLNPADLPTGPSGHTPSAQMPIPSSSSSSATPPNSLVRKESVKSLYWDSWRYRPSSAAPPVPDYPGSGGDALSPQQQVPFCSIHLAVDKRYGMMEPRPPGQRLPSMLSSFSSDDNFLSSPSTSQSQYPVPANPSAKTTHRLTSQSSVMSSVSTATTTGDEADGASMFADLASASSSCANSVFPSANNILQLVQQYDTSPATMKRQYAAAGVDERDTHSPQSVFPSPGENVIIRPSSSTPSLLLTGTNPAQPHAPQPNLTLAPTVHRKELVKFTKSSSLESSLRHRLNSDETGMPLANHSTGNSGSSNNSSNSNITSAAKMQPEKVHNSRRMHHSIHHVFKNQFFLTQTVCGFCEKHLRGLGRKCRHCKLRFHPDCAEKMPPSCGLPDGLVREYYHSINPGSRDFRVGSGSIDATTVQEDVKVEDDDDTLSEFTKRKPSDVEVVLPTHKKFATISKGSEIAREGGKTWRANLKWFASKTPPPLDSPSGKKTRLKKQRSMSTGNAREIVKSPATPVRTPPLSPDLKSPIVRRISGSFSLPKDRRKRNNLVLPKDEPKVSKSFHSLSTEQGGVDGEKARTRLPSGASLMDKGPGGHEGRTVSVSSTGGGTSPGNNSQDSLSAPSSSLPSSNSASVPASPGSISYGRSASGSTGAPVSPLALTSFVHPRNYRSFMKTVKDHIKSHFPWPAPHTKDASGSVPKSPTDTPDGAHEVRKTPVFSRRRSEDKTASQWYDGVKSRQRVMTPEEEEESVRLEAEDSFPSEPSNTFPTVLVQPNALLDAVKGSGKGKDEKKGPRRFSLLEGQEEAEHAGGTTALKVPTVEVEDDNEPSYSSEISGDHTETSPIAWRRQQSLYLRELNIPYEQLIIGEKLGPGTFGQVYRGKWHGDVAIKTLNDDYLYSDAEEVHEAFKQDLATLRKTRHDNLVLFMGACMKRSHMGHQQIIITSLLSRGLSSGSTASTSVTLHDLIHEARGKSLTAPYKVQLNRLLIIASQVCQGMGYLHRRGIVHKDLKSKNIFVTHEKCIITDYGLFSVSKMSQHGRSDDLLWFPRNWICYLAPEICRRLRTPRDQKRAFRASSNHNEPLVPFSIFSDVYAFGTVLYELCTGTFPLLYSANNAQRLVHSMSTSSVHSGVGTPSSDTPSTPSTSLPPSTPSSLNFPGGSRLPRPPDPNLPGSLDSALFLIASGAHPIFRLFRSRTGQGPRSGSTSTPGGVPRGSKHPGSPPQTLTITPGTPPTPVHAPVYLLSPSIDETAARELIEMISICWSPKMPHRKEFPELFQMLERVPKKSLARSPSHPVHGNHPVKETIHY